jgi:hypothetical protein
MRKRCLGMLAIGLLLVCVLAGCTTTAASRENLGLPTADNPEYMMHPLRLVGLVSYSMGSILQYSVAEPFYFLLAPVPEFVGLSLEERSYIAQREDAWRRYFAGERPAVQ